MKSNLEIEWWENEGTNDIDEDHKEELNLQGLNRASLMMKDSYTEGELHCTINENVYDGYWRWSA